MGKRDERLGGYTPDGDPQAPMPLPPRGGTGQSGHESAPETLTAAEVAEKLKVSYQTVLALVAEGRLPCVRIGSGPRGRLRFDTHVVERFVAAA